jgi:hypothetical protein
VEAGTKGDDVMTLATLLSINAIVALAYALGLLLVPATLLKVYGITSGPGERLMAQFFGVALLAVGLLTWFSRNVVDPSAQRAFILALLISQAVGLVVALLGTLSGVMNVVGWSAVAIYLLLALGYAYFQFTKSASPSRSH